MADSRLDTILRLTGPTPASRGSSRQFEAEPPFDSVLGRALADDSSERSADSRGAKSTPAAGDAVATQSLDRSSPHDDAGSTTSVGESREAYDAASQPSTTDDDPPNRIDDNASSPPADEAAQQDEVEAPVASEEGASEAPATPRTTGGEVVSAELTSDDPTSGLVDATPASDAAPDGSIKAQGEPAPQPAGTNVAEPTTAFEASTDATGDSSKPRASSDAVAEETDAAGTSTIAESVADANGSPDLATADPQSAPAEPGEVEEQTAPPTGVTPQRQDSADGDQDLSTSPLADAGDGSRHAESSPNLPTAQASSEGEAPTDEIAAPAGQGRAEVADVEGETPEQQSSPREAPEQQSSPREAPDRSATSLERVASPRSLQPAARTDEPPPMSPIDRARFVQRVSGAMERAQLRDGRVQVRLSPPELGSLKIEIAVRQGVLTASIEAEHSQARNVLLDNLPALRDRLAEQQIRIERFDVDVRRDGQQQPHDSGDRSGFADNSRQQDNRQGRRTVIENVATNFTAAPDAPGTMSDAALDVRV